MDGVWPSPQLCRPSLGGSPALVFAGQPVPARRQLPLHDAPEAALVASIGSPLAPFPPMSPLQAELQGPVRHLPDCHAFRLEGLLIQPSLGRCHRLLRPLLLLLLLQARTVRSAGRPSTRCANGAAGRGPSPCGTPSP